mmetsp:Transcript_7937/g.35065  ORF Transcript_7937/g.35065 Transcript_7937/m.35065 type:complete len:233 (-) Transcript_7937:579-1277(-)
MIRDRNRACSSLGGKPTNPRSPRRSSRSQLNTTSGRQRAEVLATASSSEKYASRGPSFIPPSPSSSAALYASICRSSTLLQLTATSRSACIAFCRLSSSAPSVPASVCSSLPARLVSTSARVPIVTRPRTPPRTLLAAVPESSFVNASASNIARARSYSVLSGTSTCVRHGSPVRGFPLRTKSSPNAAASRRFTAWDASLSTVAAVDGSCTSRRFWPSATAARTASAASATI